MSCPFRNLKYGNDIDCYKNCPVKSLCSIEHILIADDVLNLIHKCLVEYDKAIENHS